MHIELNYTVRPLNGHFDSVELLQLKQQGNQVINQRLCSLPKPWFPTPERYPYAAVRRLYIRAKYQYLVFAGEPQVLEVRPNLQEYWFFIDEVSEEMSRVEGPISLDTLRSEFAFGEMILKETFLWHPVLGSKWLPLHALHQGLISSPNSSSEAEICRFYEMRRHLTLHNPPHLRGPLMHQIKGKISTKWFILSNAALSVNVLSQEIETERTYFLSDIRFNLIEKFGKLGILSVNSSEEFTLWGQTNTELLEWFTELRHSQYMLQVLTFDDFPHTDTIPSEQHICNIRSSPSYMGTFIKSGYLRKQGGLFKTVKRRWFVLYATGLYYYENEHWKRFTRKITLAKGRVETDKKHRVGYYFRVVSSTVTLHLWAGSEVEKHDWVTHLNRVIDFLTSNNDQL